MNEQADHIPAGNPDQSPDQAYRVLARKYRPSNFDELIGQESLVQTLTNALSMGRLAHAFVLTGLRGIGKTTTARIIARGLNCAGADGNGGPTLSPCGVCSSCKGIAEGRHVDVIEMDAASNTGVDDVREIIDGVGYRPLSARFKIYIIDEVHMLSKNAFNALLKTLEEPPEAVKFIFATTEIRKVPVTVLSRCQRFDLRRVPNAMMADHLKNICGKENISIDTPALERLARAAEGSVRDALSLLDQAAALTADQITDDAAADMLGQAGRGQALEMTGLALAGDASGAMDKLAQAVGRGAAPLMVVNDMLDLIHLASRVAAGGHLDDAPEGEGDKLHEMANSVGIARLGRAWQIMLKGHGEISMAPNPHAAADMLLIRLAHAAVMPTPADLIRKLEKTPLSSAAPSAPPRPAATPASARPVDASSGATPADAASAPEPEPEPAPASEPAPAQSSAPEPAPAPVSSPSIDDAYYPPAAAPAPTPTPMPTMAEPTPAMAEPVAAPIAETPFPADLRSLTSLCEEKRELIIASTLRIKMRQVSFSPELICLAVNEAVDESLAVKLMRMLADWTGVTCEVKFIHQEGADLGGKTLEEEDHDLRQQEIAHISSHPLVAASLQQFPGATVSEVLADEKQPKDHEASAPPHQELGDPGHA